MKKLLGIVSLFILSSFASADLDWRKIVDVPDKYVRDVMTADLTELECLALNIYHEARSESLLGQQLVAQVTINRAQHNGFPDTVCGVVRQAKQFSWTHDGKIDHPSERRAYEDAYLVAIGALVLGQKAKVIHSSLLLNYHATYVSPSWPNLQAVMIHDTHIFYVRKRELSREEN